uniref:RAD9-HUS1-RAD1 interacting nuclear orphan 1 n=1 Tax=Gasterosteus aculeatus aculeatus TaxID=481459 RepID=A0AAQ4RN21_GASAC|nr:RAD9, HUS1, RAD1-interacting nuclear orphan protein 1 [Gasterosteus aculeatus aculeatus]
MPRKALKKDKPPLLFVEQPVRGARLQNVPEVRAALNPKEFFPETQAENSSTLTSWVRPQFDSSIAAALPARRGRRKFLSATSVLDACSSLSSKKSVCKFPSLSFHTRSRDQSHQPKSARTKKPTESTVVSDQPRGSRQTKRTVSGAQHSDTPKKPPSSIKISNGDCAASCSRRVDRPETPSIQVTEKCGASADGVSTPASNESRDTEVSGVSPPPDVDTPKVIKGGSSCDPLPSLRLLEAQTSTPPCNLQPDILVADTPERDYGVKVTWRRRRGLMMLLRERGYLSDSDALIKR